MPQYRLFFLLNWDGSMLRQLRCKFRRLTRSEITRYWDRLANIDLQSLYSEKAAGIFGWCIQKRHLGGSWIGGKYWRKKITWSSDVHSIRHKSTQHSGWRKVYNDVRLPENSCQIRELEAHGRPCLLQICHLDETRWG